MSGLLEIGRENVRSGAGEGRLLAEAEAIVAEIAQQAGKET